MELASPPKREDPRVQTILLDQDVRVVMAKVFDLNAV